MEEKFLPLEDRSIAVSLPQNMLKLQDLIDLARESFETVGLENIKGKFSKEGRGNFPVDHPEYGRKAWLSSGIDSEILQPSSGAWQKGRIRFKISLEFQPELSKLEGSNHSDASLDGLRVD